MATGQINLHRIAGDPMRGQQEVLHVKAMAPSIAYKALSTSRGYGSDWHEPHSSLAHLTPGQYTRRNAMSDWVKK
jgi:hypothetical protein